MTHMIKCLTCGKSWDGDGDGCECVCRDGDIGYETWVDENEWKLTLTELLTGNVEPGILCPNCPNAWGRVFHPAGRPCLHTHPPRRQVFSTKQGGVRFDVV